jgi:ABC-type spermidine/putrescine transport system permease subunit I
MGTLLSLAIGLPLAVIAARYDLKGKALLRILVLLSLISPPFIGAYAWIMLLGRQGIVTQAAASIGIGLPTIYGAPGIILVTALNLYPLVFLLVYGALLRIDRSLEEASLGLGRTRLQTFQSITLPLTLPAMATGGLLVFLGVLSDFGTPALLGENYPVLATLAFTLFLSEIGGNPAMASTTSVVLVTTAMLLILLQRWVVQRRNYAMEAVNRPEILRMQGWQRWAFPTFAWGMMIIANLPLAIIVYTSFLETSGPVFLQSFSLDSYRQVFHLVRGAIVNSFTFSALSLALIVVAGSVIGYIISRRDTGSDQAARYRPDDPLRHPRHRARHRLHHRLQRAPHLDHRHGRDHRARLLHPPAALHGPRLRVLRLPDRPLGRGSLDQPRRPAGPHLQEDHAAADGARHHGRCRALLGRGDQRALRHRRPLYRPDLDHADRHLQPGPGRSLRPGGGGSLAL